MDSLLLFFFILSIAFPVIHSINCLPFLQKKSKKPFQANAQKGISILIPCFNEEDIIETSVSCMKQLTYRDSEVIFINDGSSDRTLILLNSLLKFKPFYKTVKQELPYKKVKMVYQSELYPHIYVVDKYNGGKADALNAGIEYSDKSLVITLDADTILNDDALRAVNDTFQDENVVAAGGMVHVLQTKPAQPLYGLSLSNTNLLVQAQTLDFLKAFYVNKVSLARFHALAVISGAFGIFTKKALLDVGGYRSTIGEDIDITLKMHQYISKKKNRRVTLIPDAVCYTELPETVNDLFKQRVRWQKAFVDCLLYFLPFLLKSLLKKPVSFFYLFEGFISGTLAVYFMTAVLVFNLFTGEVFSLSFLIIYTLCIFIMGYAYDVLAVFLSDYHGYYFQDKDRKVLRAIFFDLFIYRFITIMAVVYGTIAYFFNNKSWNKVARTGRKYQVEEKTAA
ncbi:glycosyltransferase family 2 protein [Fictibacillus phosphorivorans]|uniref:glycosyltransferase family 2 protein n=1 Tax=Fictibacillus phosphorivorans TaxID=1221500 RepID=UPI00203EC5D6|nr:glycosyltransferase [Fictibacillus phosphorivorans]MCM3716930.1 glycosyltransferase [Fictibacillus phosphorivorans]MCM3774521.1 glycosyltransferase [Fictibacillus phosphorivorans]